MSNISTGLDRLFANGERYAYSFARGKEAFADMWMDLFATTETDVGVDDSVSRTLYKQVRTRAEVIAHEAGKPLSPQSPKSENSQVSKLHSAYLLGEAARDWPAVRVAVDYGRSLTQGKYTPLVKIAVALKAEVLKARKAKREPTAAELRAVVDAVDLGKKPTLASDAVEAFSEQLVAMAHGTDGEAGTHEAVFSAMLARWPSDMLAHVQRTLTDMVGALRVIEAEAAAPPQG